jgi:hypothetical protein
MTTAVITTTMATTAVAIVVVLRLRRQRGQGCSDRAHRKDHPAIR